MFHLPFSFTNYMLYSYCGNSNGPIRRLISHANTGPAFNFNFFLYIDTEYN